MKKFSFQWTALVVSLISFLFFTACNKEDTTLQEVKVQNESESSYDDYEKFVSDARLTIEDAENGQAQK